MVEARIRTYAGSNRSTVKMTNKKICYFEADDWEGGNRVMIFDLEDETWSIKTIDKPGFKFKVFAVAATLPNGDCLITGGRINYG